MVGTHEIILIVLVIIILFEASKIPELARSLGKAAGEFKKAKHETELELNGNRNLNGVYEKKVGNKYVTERL